MTDSFRDQFYGIIPPGITAFDSGGPFAAESAKRLYEFQRAAGGPGLFLVGLSGEGPVLN